MRKLRTELQIESVQELEEAIASGKLESVKGIGPKIITQISGSIEQWKRNRGIRLHRIARREGEDILGRALESGATGGALTGRLGRYHPTVSVITLIAGAHDTEELSGRLAPIFPGAERTGSGLLFTGETGIPVRLTIVGAAQLGAARLWHTSSETHRNRLEQIAVEKGMKFDGEGLRRGDEIVSREDEEGAYQELGLPFLPPEIREGEKAIDLARAGNLPDLFERSHIRGVLHNHSTWSDGKASLKEMAEHSRTLGYEYFGIADHSRTAGYAGGLSAERLTAQMEEVARLNREMAPFRIFHGVESDILKDGSLDYDDELLERLDYVVASIHSRYGMDGPGITGRIVSAVRNARTTVLGHPSGRLLTQRDAYDYDREAVWDAAMEHQTSIELNAHEQRLDVDWEEIPAVTGRGLSICFSPDAHTRKGLGDLDLAVHIARKGWLTRDDVINTMGVAEMDEWMEKRRRK